MQESGTFEHPQVPEGLGLRRHCLYRLALETHAAQPCVQPAAPR